MICPQEKYVYYMFNSPEDKWDLWPFKDINLEQALREPDYLNSEEPIIRDQYSRIINWITSKANSNGI